MTNDDFIVDTPNHKRWWLPDRIHQFNSVIYGDTIKVTIWHGLSGELVLSCPTVVIDQAGEWKDTHALIQELANKRFGPVLRAKKRA